MLGMIHNGLKGHHVNMGQWFEVWGSSAIIIFGVNKWLSCKQEDYGWEAYVGAMLMIGWKKLYDL